MTSLPLSHLATGPAGVVGHVRPAKRQLVTLIDGAEGRPRAVRIALTTADRSDVEVELLF